jgi:hypothetical protein
MIFLAPSLLPRVHPLGRRRPQLVCDLYALLPVIDSAHSSLSVMSVHQHFEECLEVLLDCHVLCLQMREDSK